MSAAGHHSVGATWPPPSFTLTGSDSMITKTRFLIGRQCARRLWLQDRPFVEPSSEPAEVLALRQAEGAAVEEVAAGLFEGAVRVFRDGDPGSGGAGFVGAAGTTAALSAAPAVLQAHFRAGDLEAISDVIEVRADGLFLWEVKASTEGSKDVKPLYDWDLAFQRHVIEAAGHRVVGAGLILLRADYERGTGPVVPGELLVRVDRSAQAEGLRPEVERELEAMRAVLRNEVMPTEHPSSRCKEGRAAASGNRPSTCGHLTSAGVCGRALPRTWAGYLPRLTGAPAAHALATPGRRIEDLDPDSQHPRWSTDQQRVIRTVTAGEPEVDAPALRAQLDKVQWPVAYVDFEFDPGMAVPRFPASRPYDRVPFQWALCVEDTPGAGLGAARSFLQGSASDPRRAFAESLLAALPKSGSLIAHYQAAEIGVLNELADRLGGPLADDLRALEPRFLDTLQIAKAGYHHPQQLGSYSLKKLAPALTGRGYDELAIGNGMLAVARWRQAIDPSTEPSLREQIRKDLLAYCGLDAELMHTILERLRQLSGWESAQVGGVK